MEQTISIVEIVGDSACIEVQDGQKVFAFLKKAISEEVNVSLSFLNVEMLTAAFLSAAIGQLYRDFPEEKIREKLKVEHLSQSGLVSLKRVVDTAKLYYKDPEAMQRSINEIMGE